MSYTPATWELSKQLGTPLGSGMTTVIEKMADATDSLKDVVNDLEVIFNKIEAFLKNNLDPISILFERFNQAMAIIMRDIGGLGGGFIVITPWNRMNRRYISYRAPVVLAASLANKDFSKVHLQEIAEDSFNFTIPPIELPAMTPAEAFQELEKSFYNQDDPYRPRWTSNIKTTGMAYLIVPSTLNSDLTPFFDSLDALRSFFDFKDITDCVSDYRSKLEIYAKDLKESQFANLGSSVAGAGKGNNAFLYNTTEATWTDSETGKPVKGVRASDFQLNTKLPSLHWHGLSVANIPFFQVIVDAMLELLEWLTATIKTIRSGIMELFEIIKKRIFNFIDLIFNVLNAISSAASILTATGIYSCTISPEFGGIEHIIESIRASISSPANEAASDVQKLWTEAQFCVLAFMGGGGEINTQAWADLFENMSNEAQAAKAKELTKEYTVVGLQNNAIYPAGTEVALSFASENQELYFAYELSSRGVVIADWKVEEGSSSSQINKLRPNVLAKQLRLDIMRRVPGRVRAEEDSEKESTYTLKVTKYWDDMRKVIATEEPEVSQLNFKVSTLVAEELASPVGEMPMTIRLPDDFYGRVDLLDANSGRIMDSASVYGSGEATLGQLLSGTGLYEVVITDLQGNSIRMNLAIDARYSQISLDTFQSVIYSPTIPVYVKFQKSVADVMKVTQNGITTAVSCPGLILFSEYDIPYPVTYLSKGVWRSGTITISPIAGSYKNIC